MIGRYLRAKGLIKRPLNRLSPIEDSAGACLSNLGKLSGMSPVSFLIHIEWTQNILYDSKLFYM